MSDGQKSASAYASLASYEHESHSMSLVLLVIKIPRFVEDLGMYILRLAAGISVISPRLRAQRETIS